MGIEMVMGLCYYMCLMHIHILIKPPPYESISEIEIMKRVRHRNIVSMYELYETPKCLWIILELVDGGDLHHFLANTLHYNEVDMGCGAWYLVVYGVCMVYVWCTVCNMDIWGLVYGTYLMLLCTDR